MCRELRHPPDEGTRRPGLPLQAAALKLHRKCRYGLETGFLDSAPVLLDNSRPAVKPILLLTSARSSSRLRNSAYAMSARTTKEKSHAIDFDFVIHSGNRGTA